MAYETIEYESKEKGIGILSLNRRMTWKPMSSF
jgi:hypothetical protein